MELQKANGLITHASQHTVDEIVASLSAMFRAKSITLFALIDHSGEASAIDLPLKILVWEDEGGQVQVTYNSPAYLGARHQLPDDLLKNISGIEVLVAHAVQ